MPFGQLTFGLGKNAAPRVAVRQGFRFFQRVPEHGLLVRLVGKGAGRSALDKCLSVGRQQRDIEMPSSDVPDMRPRAVTRFDTR